MKIDSARQELEKTLQGWRENKQTIAFVPTMGALHEGHLSLVEMAKKQADKVVVSVYVNPAQFAPNEDFDAYPRQEQEDIKALDRAGADLVYLPRTQELYPNGVVCDHKAKTPAAQGLESDFRPTHFDGVVSVVARLFDHVKPDWAIFGEKDYQQLCVIKDIFGRQVKILGAPIIRDEEGLALSSRNAYLSPQELKTARTLNKTLYALAEKIQKSPQDVEALITLSVQKLLDNGFHSVDYLVLRGQDSLKPLLRWEGKSARLLVAVRIGKTRLIDNIVVSKKLI